MKASCRLERDRIGEPSDGHSRRLEHQLGVVACRRGLDDGGRPVRVEACQEDRGLHLCARHREHVLDSLERVGAVDDDGRPAVRRLDARAHSLQRFGDTVHRSCAERLVAGELEAPFLPGEDSREEPHQRARVAGVDGGIRLLQSAEPDAVDDELVVREVVYLDAERADGVDRRLRVGGASEAAHVRLALGERPDEDAAVGDGLVPGHGDVPGERPSRLDSRSHASGTVSDTTPLDGVAPRSRRFDRFVTVSSHHRHGV